MPDCLSAVYDYSDKLQVNYSCYLGNEFFGYGEELCGNEGTIRVMNRQDLYFEHETYNSRRPGASDRAPAAIKARKPVHLNGMADFKEADGVINHFRNFIQSILGKEEVIAPPRSASRPPFPATWRPCPTRTRRRVVWDDSANKYHFV